eukprot:s2095_g2.t1
MGKDKFASHWGYPIATSGATLIHLCEAGMFGSMRGPGVYKDKLARVLRRFPSLQSKAVPGKILTHWLACRAQQWAERVDASVADKGPELIDFDLPLHEIAYVVASEFGPEVARCLQSSKWDHRQRALQMMSADLNGQNLQWLPPGAWQRDRRDAWRASCQVLSQVLKDKVIPVQLAALQLFRDTFENIDAGVTAEEVQHALDVLISPVMTRLGDSNVRLHESAQSNLVFTRYLLGDKLLYRLRQFLERLQRGNKFKCQVV